MEIEMVITSINDEAQSMKIFDLNLYQSLAKAEIKKNVTKHLPCPLEKKKKKKNETV